LKQYSNLNEIQRDLNSGTVTCSDLVKNYLETISSKKNLNAFLEVFEEESLARAAKIDKKIASNSAGRLAGMVLGIKDTICYKGHVVSASSKILEDFESLYTATALQRLLDEDVIVIGRTNCDEFAMGASNETSAYGVVLNDADNARVPGGSSGGSAVAVQAGMCLATLGSDTGGSIRQPASFCGVVGHKPTYGSVSRYGLLAYASSFDQIGPLTNTVEDAALITEIMSGKDEQDATLSENGKFQFNEEKGQKLRIAYLKDCIDHPGLDGEIKEHCENLFAELKSEGHTVEGVDFPYLDYMVPCYYVLTTAEASSNLSRYSGLMYGHRSTEATDLESTFKKSRSEGFGEEVQRRIMLGTFVLSSDYYDAYYTKAQKVRRLIKIKTEEIFENFDLIILPTTSTTAFKLNEKSEDPIAMYLADLFTVQANLSGNPAISLPLGHHNSSNMPFGIQVIGKSFDENTLFSFAKELMKES
jgi:aspartyl-tRNA(Asn)/glutamyl-tRNA(Gln) amidotransferase subunit A